jgi:hypothetical protein
LGHAIDVVALQKWWAGQDAHCSAPGCAEKVPLPQGAHWLSTTVVHGTEA